MWAPASTWATRVALDAAEVARLHLLGEELPAGRVDPLADDRERPVEADDDLARRRRDDRLGHDGSTAAAGARRRFGGSRHAAVSDQLVQDVLRVRGLEPGDLGVRLALEVVAAGPLLLVPLLDVVAVRFLRPAFIAALSTANWKRLSSTRLATAGRPSR